MDARQEVQDQTMNMKSMFTELSRKLEDVKSRLMKLNDIVNDLGKKLGNNGSTDVL